MLPQPFAYFPEALADEAYLQHARPVVKDTASSLNKEDLQAEITPEAASLAC